MTRWNLAVVVGVPGVGKTSLCREASQSEGYQYINYGELMLEIALKRKIASNQEEMFNLPLEIQHKIWREAATLIRDLTEDSKEGYKNKTDETKDFKGVLVDLHGLDRSEEGYLISLPFEILKPQIIIIIESTYNQIIQHRIKDPERIRPIETLKSLNQEMKLLRDTMAICAAILGSYFVIMENDEFKESLIRLKKYL